MKCQKFYIFLFLILGFINTVYAQQYEPNNIPICTNPFDQSETAIAIDPNNNSHLFSDWNDFRNINNSNVHWHIGYGFSQNDLNLWNTNLLINTSGQFEGGFDPSVDFDKNSNIYLCYIASNSGLGPVYIAKTQNNGTSWSYHQVSSLNYAQDKPYMTIDKTSGNYSGKIYVSWTDFSSGSRILTSFSSDNGITWSTANQISSLISASPGMGAYLYPQYNQSNVQSAFVQGSIPSIAPNGNIYIVYLLSDGGNGSSGKIKICKSTNGGISYSSPTTIADISVAWGMQLGNGLRASSLPTIVIDPKTGNIYVAYTQNDNGNLNIYYTYSTDGGSTWSSPQIATQNTTGNQFFPWLSVSPEGTISLIYYQGNSSSVNVYVAESYNSGISFYTPNTKISSVSSNPNNIANGNYTSDYIGMASAEGYNFYPAWTDFRNSNADIYMAKYNSLDKLSYENKSLYIASTFPNSSRQLQKAGGKLHEIFASGGEVFYRRSADNGSTWELTRRLSTGNGSNGRQCIAIGHDGNIYVVWQRKIGSSNYEVWYTGSQNNGTTWSTPKTITGSTNVSTSWVQSAGVMPVISEIELTPQDHEIVVVYCSSQGLKYSISESDEDPGANWSTPQVISGSYDSYVEFPSLAKGQGFLSLTYDYRYYGVYSRTFNGGTWSSETYISNFGTIEDRYSSVSVDGNNDIVAAWCAQENGDSDYRILFRYGYSNNTWSNWEVEFNKIPGISSYYPAITYYNKGGSNNYGVAIVYHTSEKQIRMKKYDVGTVWYDYTLSNSGRYANITTEDYDSGTPEYIWTDQNGSPYTVSLGSQYLPKKLLATDGIRKRRAVFTDTLTKSSLCFQVGDFKIRTRKGEEMPLYFREYNHRDRLKLRVENICRYISSEPIVLPLNTKSISFTDTIYTITISDSSNSDIRQVFTNYSYSLHLVDGRTGVELCMLDSGKVMGPRTVDISRFAGREVRLKPEIKILGISSKSLEFGLVDIISPANFSTPKLTNNKGQWRTAPANFALFQNYPNPFNSTTTIGYQLSEASHVMIGIYDLQGRLVETLVNGEKQAGSYSVTWDAKNQPSGVYFYRIQAGKFTATKKLLLLK